MQVVYSRSDFARWRRERYARWERRLIAAALLALIVGVLR